MRFLTLLLVLLSFSGILSLAAQTDSGLASWYSDSLTGQKTASGEPYDPTAFTAAHRTLRFGIRLEVTNPADGRSVVVRINDRGPFVEGRIVDLSRAAAEAIGLKDLGVVPVTVRVLRAGEEASAVAAAVPAAPSVWFQMGAFRSQSNAQALAAHLARSGHTPSVRQDGGLFRVCLSTAEDQAETLAARLVREGWKGALQLRVEPKGSLVKLTTD